MTAVKMQVLEGLEAVRKRPGMYIGSTGPRGLHHLVYEIVDNAIDEALAGFCDTDRRGTAARQCGPGLGTTAVVSRWASSTKLGIPAVTVVFTMLHAGGKFGGGGYKVSGGLHGVGASVVNALSVWLEVEVCRDGRSTNISSALSTARPPGNRIYQDLGPLEDPSETGTTVRLSADPGNL